RFINWNTNLITCQSDYYQAPIMGALNEKKETLSYKIESHDIIKFKDYGLTDDNWIDYSRQ
uniref:hypothetical protein n=1 Tax=Parabacteroides sp. D26 TaxID=658662 RepID=UPI0035646368